MDQKELRELEKQCIQEEAPECVAACPIHVDVRTFIQDIQKGEWHGAWKTLQKTMPFPSILGRICDAPCRERCKRREVGDPIDIHELERACVSRPGPAFRIPPIPRKGAHVAVVGSGLSSLTTAWDLLRKGYAVEIFEPSEQPGSGLRNVPPHVLPPGIIDETLSVLEKMGCHIATRVQVDSQIFLQRCRDDFDAVYLGLDAVQCTRWPLKKDAAGVVVVMPKIQSTSLENIFAGGLSSNSASSPVWQAAEGRWAAATIDRCIQKVSLTAGREKDGPYPTRLFTSLKGVDPGKSVAVSDPAVGYSDEEARTEAGRCLQCACLECVKACVYLKEFHAYPKRYAREIYNNESIVMGARQANKLINSCSLCGLCERVCPEHFAMQDLCLQARRRMVQRGKMPPSAHEFALLDMAFSLSDRFALARHEPGTATSRYVFFPGCQLCASYPDKVELMYAYLRKSLTGGVGLMLGCCAAPAYWAGREQDFQKEMDTLKDQWTALGRPEVILACSTCFQIFKEHLPEVAAVSLWNLLETIGLTQTAAWILNTPLAVHDPCTTRREPNIRSSVRNLLVALGVVVKELPLSGELTECCGFGGLMRNANSALAEKAVSKRAGYRSEDYVTYCAMCRDSLAGAGKRTWHLLDLIFPETKTAASGRPDPAGRKPPNLSQRMENRARLKDALQTALWNEMPMEKTEHETIILKISPDVRRLMEARRILNEDVQKVVYQAQQSGRKFFNQSTQRLKASFKPYHAIFWVEYSLEDDGYRIHNAYTHRMEVVRS